MLTPTGRALAGGGGVLVATGVFFGNWPLFGAGALLLILISFGSLARPPRVTVGVDRDRVERGGRFHFTMDVEMPRGVGVVEIHQALPEEFELVEGNNLHVLSYGVQPRKVTFTFETRAPKRGEWKLPPVGVRVIHPLGFATSPALSAREGLTVNVVPRPLAARVPRDLRTRARRPFPEGDVARMGFATNDFRELREYVPGDPPRRINWKATARRMESGASEVPLVNETEFEGKKCVYILVDGHARLSVGTNLEDAREHAADAALSIMEAYLERGYQVGLALARSGNMPPLRFHTGSAQVARARDLLSRLHPAEGPSLVRTMDRDSSMLHGARPLIVLVTRLAGSDPDIRSAIKRMSVLGRMQGRNIVPGLIVDVEHEIPEDAAAVEAVAHQALDNDRRALQAYARAAGVRVTRWRPAREPLASVLVRGRIA